MKRRRLSLLSALLVCLHSQAATEVIPLEYRMADDVLAVAQSVVGEQGKVNAYGNQLIVNAPDSVIAELRTVLSRLDTAPRRLLISVDTQNAASDSESGFQVDGSFGGGNVRLETGQNGNSGENRVRIIRHSTASQGGGVQQVQATEGYPALIQVGQSVPITTRDTDGYGQIYQQTQYRDVTRGFYATATVHGEQVQVTISSHDDRLDRYQPGVVNVRDTDTRVSGRLGEWIPLGGVNESASANQRGTLRRYSTTGQEDFSLRLKVERLD
ncbi:secretin N-terminal domain-containing protein [Stutzerimonas marianensis]|uniref:secretin N-terminal domain-containing protein n=1 Tax=Stutzerimonas marianensis TaxID=2929513 RepID=UPI003C2AAE1C